MRESDNYYVLITREDLHDLPYSIEEIYEIKSSGRYHNFNKYLAYKKEYLNKNYLHETEKNAVLSLIPNFN